MNGLLLLFAFLNAVDGWETWQVIRFGGHEVGVPKFLMEIIGTYWTLVILKVGIVLFIWALNVFDQMSTIWFMALVDAGYFILVASNYRQLRKLKGF